MPYKRTCGNHTYNFIDLKTLLAKASPYRSGDALAGIAASNDTERSVAQKCLSDLPLSAFLQEPIISYDDDEVTRLIYKQHDTEAFKPVRSLTVGEFREWLLSDNATKQALSRLTFGLTPEMVAATSKIMRIQDLIKVSKKCEVITRFRTTIGLQGRLSTRLQPNHPTDDLKGIAASILDGLLYGIGDAVIGINPATDHLQTTTSILNMIDELRQRFSIPIQSCVLTHITQQMKAIENHAPLDLIFQSIAGTQTANHSFGISLAILQEAYESGLQLKRGELGSNIMYFETGQGSALSADAHHGVDQQTCEARAYAVAREFNPLLVNTVVGFIGPEYLYDGKQIIRAGIEDHFCGKLLGLPMGCDICYTNHAEANQDDMDTLLTLLGTAGCNFIMGIPGSDDIMLNYQSTSYHDAQYIRHTLGLKPAPEFEAWLRKMNIIDPMGTLAPIYPSHTLLKGEVSNQKPPVLKTKENSLNSITPNPWTHLQEHTTARIALGHAGGSLLTSQVLSFQYDHARARDAIHSMAAFDKIKQQITEAFGIHPFLLESAVENRREYLTNPNLGRRLSTQSRDTLLNNSCSATLSLVIGDGLCATAINHHVVSLLIELFSEFKSREYSTDISLVKNARVAIGDEIGEIKKSSIVVVLIGERPGLSNAESIGAYITYNPRIGCSDAQRNCISNISPNGLKLSEAAIQIAHIVSQALTHRATGVALEKTTNTLL